ncbi:MAG: hypothetical protein BIFFINMI_02107 [Phycisphaerae bacterium]|nr:hypothetical protein [Phycisphaerae bacterium]
MSDPIYWADLHNHNEIAYAAAAIMVPHHIGYRPG